MKLTTAKVLGFTFDVQIDSDGEFWVKDDRLETDGFRVRGRTLKDLKEELAKQIRRQQLVIALQFVTREGRRGTIRGIHARSSDTYLVTWENGEKGNVRSYTGVLNNDAPAERLAEITAMVHELQEEQSRIAAEHRLNVPNELAKLEAAHALAEES